MVGKAMVTKVNMQDLTDPALQTDRPIFTNIVTFREEAHGRYLDVEMYCHDPKRAAAIADDYERTGHIPGYHKPETRMLYPRG